MNHSLPYVYRHKRTLSRPRAFFVPEPCDQDYPSKKRSASPTKTAPPSAVVSAIAVAFFVFGLLVARNMAAFDLPSLEGRSSPLMMEEVPSVTELRTENVVGLEAIDDEPERQTVIRQDSDDGKKASNVLQGQSVGPLLPLTDSGEEDVLDKHADKEHVEEKAVEEEDKAYVEDKDEDGLVVGEEQATRSSEVDETRSDKKEAEFAPELVDTEDQALSAPVPDKEGQIGWDRSWPLSEQYDSTGLIPLSKKLGLTNRTFLNYFHMHKTGGVSTKVDVMVLFNRDENKQTLTMRGEPIGHKETCYEVENKHSDKESIEHMWRCDWGQLRKMSAKELASVDVMLGHQYWENGCNAIFGKARSVKHFSIFRHPLPRKLSFFYHFFVRNLQRDESEVGKEEVISFLLADDMPDDASVRDAGPNYYASRLLSNGTSGFANTHRFTIEEGKQDAAIAQIQRRLDNDFVFTGLQLQSEASQCMLQKMLQVFAHEHGIDNLVGTSQLLEGRRRLNTGDYPWTAHKIWGVMTAEQRKRYRYIERVDLALYERAVKKFKRDVKLFSCEDHLREDQWNEDVYE